MYSSVCVQNTDCTICKFYNQIFREKIRKKKNNTRAT